LGEVDGLAEQVLEGGGQWPGGLEGVGWDGELYRVAGGG